MKRENILTKSPVVCLLAFFCCALWGSAFPCIKIGYHYWNIAAADSPTQIVFAGVRFMFAGGMVILLQAIQRKEIHFPKIRTWKRIGVLCIFQTILQYIFFYIGLANTTGVKASIIESMSVFVALLVASLFFHQERFTGQKLFGMMIGFLGVVLVNLENGGISLSISMKGEGFVLLSTISYAVSSVLVKSFSKEEDPVELSGYQFFLGGFCMILVGLVFGGNLVIPEQNTVLAWSIIIYLALVSAIAYTIWGILLKFNPVSKVAIFGFMNPVCGVILSTILLKENRTIGIESMLALCFVCLGIYVVYRER